MSPRALTLLGGDAVKLHQRTAALLATLPQVDPRELHALGDALGGSDRVALAAFIDSVDRWVSERLRADDANANANFRALHGWRRCGKRSTAPRATPKTTISSESRWFSRCSGCLRRRRARRSADGQSQQSCSSNKRKSWWRRRRKKPSRNERRRKPASRYARRRRRRKTPAMKRAQRSRPKRQQKKRRSEETAQKRHLKKSTKKTKSNNRARYRTRRARRATGHRSTNAQSLPSRLKQSKVAVSESQVAIVLLHHDRDRLSQRRAAYRPRV